VVSAPYDGYISEDFARPGDVVEEGDLLARLDDRELQLELAAWRNRRTQYEAERQNALAEHAIAQAQVYQAQMAEADVQIELISGRIAQTEIRAPFDGLILSGDLSQGLGSGVRLGDPLFQIAPLSSYRVVLNVDEEDITRLELGQTGELLLASRPDRPLSLKISRMTAVTTPEAGRNFFRVEALLDVAPSNLRPGMQGTAVGIVGNVEGLGLEALGVKIDRTHVVTDEYCRTGVEGLYAIGDVAGAPWLAHKASHEGVMIAELIAGGKPHAVKPESIAGCTYCHPQVASVGLTEAKAKEAGYDVKVGRFPFIGNGKAIALGEPEGMVKTVFDAKTGELLGAHMIGAEVTEMIQGYVVGRQLETTEEDLMQTVFPHPTLSEMMHESVLDAYGRALHI
jgi:biotin carboxyl carrier protein